jgi:hypothetical protein
MSSNNYLKTIASQSVSLSAASQQVTMTDPRTMYVRLASGPTALYYKSGANPTATTSDTYLPLNWVDYIQISPGEKIAVLGTSASNAVSIAELSS